MSGQSMLCGCVVVADKTQRYLALSATSAHTTILSTTSRTRLTQTYVNKTGSLVKEARYMFPMYDGVSAVEFTCTIGPRVIRGVVRERQEAKRIFDQATARGEAAGLLEQSLSTSDVFIGKLGNVPAGEDVKVDVTYLGELEHDAEIDGLRFTIPTAIAPRYGYHAYRDLVSAPEVRVQGKIAVTVDIDLDRGVLSSRSSRLPTQHERECVARSVASDDVCIAVPRFRRAQKGLYPPCRGDGTRRAGRSARNPSYQGAARAGNGFSQVA